MNRDALLATLIGFGIGLVITGLLILGPNMVKSFPKISLPQISLPKAQPKTQPTPTPKKQQPLTIDSPLPEAIENKSNELVSGVTTPKAVVVVAGPVDETVVSANEEGKYAGSVALVEGKNDLIVTSYVQGETNVQTAKVTVFYTPEEL